MDRAQLQCLHYITPIANLPSIMQHGILSHERASKLPHQSVALQAIQDKRAPKLIPGGRPLHQYVNLYFNPRNKMMSRVRDRHREICVLCISLNVLDLPGTVISDQNASSKYALFLGSPQGLKKLDHAEVFADDWRHPGDQIREWRHGSIVCAEVLVADRVSPDHITGAFASCADSRDSFTNQCSGVSCSVNSRLFFS